MRKLVVVVVALALVGVGLGAGYLFLTRNPSVTPPVTPPTATAPVVSSTSPLASATGILASAKVTATFSRAMDPATITPATFGLKLALAPVPGAVSYSGTTATFSPTSLLVASSAYTATITTGAKDTSGRALAANVVWSFTTGIIPDTTAPTVTSTSGTVAVAVGSDISAVFSEAMNPATVTTSTFTIMQGAAAVTGAVTYASLTATFNPASDLAAGATYSATISTGAKDVAGNALATSRVWSFTTAAGAPTDTIAPVVSSTSPTLGVAINSNVLAVFSEAMDPLTVTVSTFTISRDTSPVSGLVSYTGTTATFDPSSDFAADATYTATVTTEAKDVAGNGLASNHVWTFTTAAGACAQLTVNLGAAATFAVLAGATVTNTGSTAVTGDVGVSPGTSITGFPPGTVSGTIHYTDTASAAGIADLTTAYNDAAGRTLCPIGIIGDIGGQTLGPGLYKSTSGLEVTTADLTLDAQGNADAIFIFQIATTLDVADGKHVILIGGAKASNIFWQVGTSAIFGTTSSFVGTVMADQSITLNTGASLEGRALARIAAVNLDANAVTRP